VIPRPRIQGLSDLIFGLALSIGAIVLVSSSASQTLTDSQIVFAVAEFGFNFLILLNIWNRYTSITSAIPVQTLVLERLNMLLLFLVAVEPYFFNLLIARNLSSPLGQDVSAYFALDIGLMNLVIGYFNHLLTIEESHLIPKELIHKFKVGRNVTIAIGIIFLVSAIPVFWSVSLYGTQLRYIVWIATFPLAWASRLFGSAAKVPDGDKETIDKDQTREGIA
jgi:uncharacterized membrane protein